MEGRARGIQNIPRLGLISEGLFQGGEAREAGRCEWCAKIGRCSRLPPQNSQRIFPPRTWFLCWRPAGAYHEINSMPPEVFLLYVSCFFPRRAHLSTPYHISGNGLPAFPLFTSVNQILLPTEHFRVGSETSETLHSPQSFSFDKI